MEYWRIETHYAVGMIDVDDDGIIRETAPIFNWMRGKPLSLVISWAGNMGHRIHKLQ